MRYSKDCSCKASAADSRGQGNSGKHLKHRDFSQLWTSWRLSHRSCETANVRVQQAELIPALRAAARRHQGCFLGAVVCQTCGGTVVVFTIRKNPNREHSPVWLKPSAAIAISNQRCWNNRVRDVLPSCEYWEGWCCAWPLLAALTTEMQQHWGHLGKLLRWFLLHLSFPLPLTVTKPAETHLASATGWQPSRYLKLYLELIEGPLFERVKQRLAAWLILFSSRCFKWNVYFEQCKVHYITLHQCKVLIRTSFHPDFVFIRKIGPSLLHEGLWDGQLCESFLKTGGISWQCWCFPVARCCWLLF